MTEEIMDLIDCPAIEYIAVGNQYFCKVNSCDCTKISTCGYKRLEQENNAYKQSEQEATEIIAELEYKNKELKKQIESQKGLITVGGKQQYDMTMAYDKCKTALEKIKEIVASAFAKQRPYKEDFTEIENIINEVLNG